VAPQTVQGLQTVQVPPWLVHLAACAGHGGLPQLQPLQLLPPAGMQLGSKIARGSLVLASAALPVHLRSLLVTLSLCHCCC
jgi:hypothetical protein